MVEAAIIGEALGITGFWSYVAAFAVNYAISVQVTRIFGEKPPSQSDQGTRQQIPPNTANALPTVYGDAYLGGTFVDAALTTDQTTMYYVLAVSCISSNGTFTFDQTKMYYGDRLITFGTGPNVASLTDQAGNVDTSVGVNSRLQIYLYTSNDAGVITNVNSSLSPSQVMGSSSGLVSSEQWTGTRQMNGLAFAIVRLVYDRTAQTTQLQPITFKVTQNLNGLDRARPGDVWYDYMTNQYYGGAVDPDFIDTSTRDALNTYSDQTITYTPSGGGTATQRRYKINGVINAGQTVLSNIDKILSASDSWMAYSPPTGKWSIVINKAESTAYSFDDNNIIGELRVSATDITNSVNVVEASFPNKDNKDQTAYVNLDLSVLNPSLLYPNEPVNKATIAFDLVNDNVQAYYLANRILEQAREDLVISFGTTYYGIQVNAGDVISVTNSGYGWTNKLFRVVKVNEASLQDGTLAAKIDATEYNAQVYDDQDITAFSPVPNSGLPSPAYFSALSAPTVVGYPSASIPYFNVTVTIPTTGRVTWGSLYYTTSATPSASDWILLTTAESSNSAPVPNGSTYVFKNQILSAGTYYFAYVVGNDISQSELSAKSSAFVWTPVGMVGPTGPTGTTGPTGPSVTGETGPRNASGYIYYGTASATAPAAPTASGFNFTNGTFSTLTSGWSTTFTAPAPVTNPATQAGSKFWAVRYAVSEATYGGTQTVTLTSVFNWQNLDGLVTFTNVVAPSGTTFIDGGNIITDTLTVSTIKNKTSGTYGTGGNYVTFGLGLNISIGSYPAGGTFSSADSGYYGIIATNTAGGNAIGCGTTSTNPFGSGVVGVGAGTSTFVAFKNSGALGTGDSGGSFQTNGSGYLQFGTSADIRLAYYTGGTSYAYYIYSGAAYPFTAGHDAMQLLTESIPEVGDLMVDVTLIAADSVNDTITQMSVSSSANQKGVIGVFTGVAGEGFVPSALSEYVEAPDGTKTLVQLKPEYANIYDTYRCIGVNAIGEGKMNVCGQGGDIEIGDFIVASDMPGKGMKQADDVFHSYTVAKARENVTFSSPTEVQSIAIIYMGG